MFIFELTSRIGIEGINLERIIFFCLDTSEDDEMPHSTSPEEALMTRLVRNYLKLNLSATQKICNGTIYKMNDSGMGKYFDGFIFLEMYF